MNANDSSEHESEQPLSKIIKLYYDTQSSDSSQETEEKTAVKKKRERQQRYREQNREKLRLRAAERRKRQHNLVIIPEKPTNTNRIELNNGEITHDISQSSGLGGTQTSSVQKNEQAEEKNALQKKRERQQRYREHNREKLKKRELERRQYQKKCESIAKSNIECLVVISEALQDKVQGILMMNSTCKRYDFSGKYYSKLQDNSGYINQSLVVEPIIALC